MTTDDSGKMLFVLIIACVTMCLLGSFVVSLNIIQFIYLVVLYTYIYVCYRVQKNEKD